MPLQSDCGEAFQRRALFDVFAIKDE